MKCCCIHARCLNQLLLTANKFAISTCREKDNVLLTACFLPWPKIKLKVCKNQPPVECILRTKSNESNR